MVFLALVFNCCIATRLLSWMRYCKVNSFLIACWCSFSVVLPVRQTFLSVSPCMIPYNIWNDLRMCLHSVVLKGFGNAHELELTDLCSISFTITGRLTFSFDASTCVEHFFRFNIVLMLIHIALNVRPVVALLAPLWVTSRPWLINPSINPKASISGKVVARWCRKLLNKGSLLRILLATLRMWVSFRGVRRVLLWVSQVVLPFGPSMLSLAVGHDNRVAVLCWVCNSGGCASL